MLSFFFNSDDLFEHSVNIMFIITDIFQNEKYEFFSKYLIQSNFE